MMNQFEWISISFMDCYIPLQHCHTGRNKKKKSIPRGNRYGEAEVYLKLKQYRIFKIDIYIFLECPANKINELEMQTLSSR